MSCITILQVHGEPSKKKQKNASQQAEEMMNNNVSSQRVVEEALAQQQLEEMMYRNTAEIEQSLILDTQGSVQGRERAGRAG